MNISSSQSGHWTDEELIATIYGVGPSGDHIRECLDCQVRLSHMQSTRNGLDELASERQVNDAFLAEQRRAIYRRMEEPSYWWRLSGVRQWAAGLTAAALVGGSIFFYEQQHQLKMAREEASDAQLVQQVAAMANDSDLTVMAPLQGLFE